MTDIGHPKSDIGNRSYPGGKAGAGTIHRIINQIPPHRRYIELFAGGAAVLRHKRPAASSIAIDADAAVVERLQRDTALPAGTTIICAEASSFLRAHDVWKGASAASPAEIRLQSVSNFIYADPPYVMASRKQHDNLYRHEMTDEQHVELLELLRRQVAMVMISSYWSPLYGDLLHDWRMITFQSMTHRGPVTEYLWMNYPEPDALHDYRYLGNDFRERERIKRQQTRWRHRLAAMPPTQRYAMLAVLEEFQHSPGQPSQI